MRRRARRTVCQRVLLAASVAGVALTVAPSASASGPVTSASACTSAAWNSRARSLIADLDASAPVASPARPTGCEPVRPAADPVDTANGPADDAPAVVADAPTAVAGAPAAFDGPAVDADSPPVLADVPAVDPGAAPADACSDPWQAQAARLAGALAGVDSTKARQLAAALVQVGVVAPDARFADVAAALRVQATVAGAADPRARQLAVDLAAAGYGTPTCAAPSSPPPDPKDDR